MPAGLTALKDSEDSRDGGTGGYRAYHFSGDDPRMDDIFGDLFGGMFRGQDEGHGFRGGHFLRRVWRNRQDEGSGSEHRDHGVF